MSVINGAPQNDRSIFAAVSSLMKAQGYELGALPARKKSPSIYQFNLLSIVDAALVRLMFNGTKVVCSSLDAEHYIARYIINKKETFARIRFIQADFFARALQDYGRLHLANCQWFASECDFFYADAFKNTKKSGVLDGEFSREVGWFLSWRTERHTGTRPDLSDLFVYWHVERKLLQVSGAFGHRAIPFLNADQEAKQRVARALKNIYRYEGPFEFEDNEVPF